MRRSWGSGVKRRKSGATEFSIGKLGTKECKMLANPTFRREEDGEISL